MAIARLSMKVGRAGQASPHAAYIAREGKYAHRLEQGEKLEACEAGNMPAWAEDNPLLFWQVADAHERSNGTTYREMEIALPRELDAEQRIALVRAFVSQEIGGKHAYQWAIHTPLAVDGQDQPHLHLMFSERQADGIERDPEQYFKRYNARSPEKGGARKGYGPHAGQTLSRSERAADLKELRGRWETMANEHLEQLGHSARIDMRSHAERGTGLVPEMKQLPSQWRGEGRENVIEFRQARAEFVQAHEHVQSIVPNAPAEIISLEAERERRIVAQRQAEQQRIERMTSAELRAEMERMRPPEVKAVVEGHPEVMAARQACESLFRQMKEAEATMERARREMKAWREAHPLRARTHDLGLIQSRYLAEHEQMREEAWSRGVDLFPKVNDARQRAEYTASDVEARTRLEQMPVRERIEELEQVWTQKVVQEQADRRQEANLNRAMSLLKVHAFKREIKAQGYRDTGEQWKALPEGTREVIGRFNKLPKEEQPRELERLREHFRKQGPQVAEGLVEVLSQGKSRGGGRSRGGSSEPEMKLKRSRDRDQEWER